MSTIVRSSPDSRGGRAARESQGALTARALRVRNACLRRAAVRLGLRIPDDAELRALPADVTMTEAIRRWKAVQQDAEFAAPAGPGLLLRTAFVTAVTLLALALSYGRAQ